MSQFPKEGEEIPSLQAPPTQARGGGARTAEGGAAPGKVLGGDVAERRQGLAPRTPGAGHIPGS